MLSGMAGYRLQSMCARFSVVSLALLLHACGDDSGNVVRDGGGGAITGSGGKGVGGAVGTGGRTGTGGRWMASRS